MKAIIVVLVVLAIVVGGLFMWGVGVSNRLVTAEQAVNGAWAQVQTVYQRRADLIPNLVETVKGFAAQERTVLEEVTRARASAGQMRVGPEITNDPQALRRFQQAQQELGGALSRLLVTVERYPDLKSNANFLALQSQLEGTENRITVERRRYNETVQDLQHPAPPVPGQPGRRLPRLQGEGLLRGRAGQRDRAQGQVLSRALPRSLRCACSPRSFLSCSRSRRSPPPP